jgi:hypothetical protein
MKRLNWLLTFVSFIVLIVTVERFSFTTRLVLPPSSFLRLHEVLQMALIILTTVVLSWWLLQALSDDFALLTSPRGRRLAVVFLIGVYFYATGNGAHEIASYVFTAFCEPTQLTGPVCGSAFMNDYYFGNILFFLGAFLMRLALMLFERMHPDPTFTRRDWVVLAGNGLVYALAIFAYAAFDRVVVGLVYAAMVTGVIVVLLVTAPTPVRALPFTLYSVIAYGLGTTASLLVRWP